MAEDPALEASQCLQTFSTRSRLLPWPPSHHPCRTEAVTWGVHAHSLALGEQLEPHTLPEPLQDGSRRMWVTLLYLGSLGSTVRKSCWASWQPVTPARVSSVLMVATRLGSTSKAKICLKAEPSTQEKP